VTRRGGPRVAPCGTWSSSISAAQVAAGSIRLSDLQVDGDDVYWAECRPQEQGRYVVVRRDAKGRIADVTPRGFNARSGVHQYGGGSFAVHDGAVYFSNFSGFADNQLYRQERGGQPIALARSPQRAYGDIVVDAPRKRVICVREDHGHAGPEAINTLVSLRLDGAGRDQVLASGADFYSNPRLSPNGRQLSWLQWSHPHMPWDATELWLARVDDKGQLVDRRRVDGDGDESIFQPQWSPDGVLHFVSDRSGWWNLYRLRLGKVEALAPMSAEFADAQWLFGQTTYDFTGDGRIVCSYTRNGRWHLAVLGASSKIETLELPYAPHLSVRAQGNAAVFIGTSPSAPDAIVRVDLGRRKVERLHATGGDPDADSISIAEAIEFQGAGGRSAYAFHYAPKNPACRVAADEQPPLIVISHGGPTSSATDSLDLKIQYWTSRGFAVVDVNYGGSTGYGRAYRKLLNGRWGIVDVEDCIAAARFLVAKGKADPERLIIRGGSAGGYTTLAALTFHDVFKAGASHYGVSDVEALALDTHKFESRYLDHLIGPYPAQRELYRARSPIRHVERMRTPLILFQGMQDKVVPPSQSAKMAKALRAQGIPVAYVTFKGEQHGFRHAASIVRALESELAFYGAVFGFTPAGKLPALHIDNLESAQ
jgi:dipeptidyl aminopeptidase/acylaminoacyl peptidase